MSTLRESQRRTLESRANAWNEMTSIMDLAEREGRELSAEERQSWDRAEERITELTADLERIGRQLELEGRFADIQSDPVLAGAGTPRGAANDEERVTQAFRNFLRAGIQDLSHEDRAIMASRMERRALAEGTTTAGGYLVPTGYWKRISEVLRAYGGLLGISNVIHTTTGVPLPWPNNDDTANVGSILGENTQVTELDLAVGQRILNAWTYTSNLVLVSLELLQDSAFDLDEWIPKKLGVRIGRAVANHLMNGTGTGQPTGIISSVATGKTGLTGQTTTIIYDDIVDLVHSVDPAYRAGGNCRFVLADTSLAVIRKLKDSYGHPLWQPSVSASDPDFLLGYPLTIDQATPAMAANAKSVLFGDFEAGYVVRQSLDTTMMRLTERYADYLQVGFVGFMRLDARPDDANAVKAYVNSAT